MQTLQYIFLERGFGTYWIIKELRVSLSLPSIPLLSSRAISQIIESFVSTHSKWDIFYLFGRQDKSRGCIASIFVDYRALVAETFCLIFVFFGRLAMAHRNISIEVGSSLFVKGFEGEGMSLALSKLMILIVLHSPIIIMKAKLNQSDIT